LLILPAAMMFCHFWRGFSLYAKKHKSLHIGCMFEFDHLILSHFTEDRPHKKMSHLISQFSKPLLCLEVSEH